MTALNITANCVTNIARARFVRVYFICYTIYCVMLCAGYYGILHFSFMYKVRISDGRDNTVVFAEFSAIEQAVKLALDLHTVTATVAKSNNTKYVDVDIVSGDTVVLSFLRPASER